MFAFAFARNRVRVRVPYVPASSLNHRREVQTPETVPAEPNRKAPYSSDIRWRIIWQKFGMDLTHCCIARNLSISIGTVHNVLKLFEETGEVSPKQLPEREDMRKIDNSGELSILGLLIENPSLYLGEICQKIDAVFCSCYTINCV